MEKKDKKRVNDLIFELTGNFWGVCMALKERGGHNTDEMVKDFNEKMGELQKLINRDLN